MQGNALKKLGLLLCQQQIFLLRSPGSGDGNTLQGGVIGLLHFRFMKGLVLGELLAGLYKFFPREQQQFGIFQSLCVIDRGLLEEKTFEIADPPVFEGEIDDDFLVVFVDDIAPKAAFVDVSGGIANLARPKIKFLLF